MSGDFKHGSRPKVLIVGSGAREHAIAWKLAQSSRNPILLAAPGNPGMKSVAECRPVRAEDIDGILQLVQDEQIDLVVIGPEAPLSLGLADRLGEIGVRAFGPAQAAAQLEASKAFAKALMAEAGVPTASYQAFVDADAAKAYIGSQGAPIVVKADGLAAGKGVVVAQTVDEACAAVDDMLVERRFGASGSQVVVESFLEGEEVSLMFFVDGETCVPMVSARDHKRIGEGDTGPNTGGMGAFAPVPGFAEPGHATEVEARIVRPVLAALASRGIVYRGVLYVGLMMTADGPYVVEFNARFGDPETQVVLPLLKSDLFEVCWSISGGDLASTSIEWDDGVAVCVVLAAAGYPGTPRSGDAITLPEGRAENGQSAIFHAGTSEHDGSLVTSGGRVLTAVGWGKDLASARRIAYDSADAIYFEGKYMRRDIAASGNN